MIINDLDGYYIVFDTKNWNTELDTLVKNVSDEVEEPDRFLVLFIPQRYLHLAVVELRYTIPSEKHDQYRRILEIKQVRLNLAAFRE